MERLTVKADDGTYAINKRYTAGNVQEVVDRLAAYEDTGLEPEEVERSKLTLMGKSLAEITEFDGVSIKRLKELVRAEKAGRLVVLPCKVGDIVFGITRYGRHAPFVVVGTVKEMYFANEDMRLCIVAKGFRGEWGKVVFGTREEAERALEGQK